MRKAFLFFTACVFVLGFSSAVVAQDPDPLPEIIVQIAVPDTAQQYSYFDGTLKVWNMEDTTVVVNINAQYNDPGDPWVWHTHI